MSTLTFKLSSSNINIYFQHIINNNDSNNIQFNSLYLKRYKEWVIELENNKLSRTSTRISVSFRINLYNKYNTADIVNHYTTIITIYVNIYITGTGKNEKDFFNYFYII